MTYKIAPALTPEEWAEGKKAKAFTSEYKGVLPFEEAVHRGSAYGFALADQYETTSTNDPELMHAAAALCLHGQPFGFTWEDVKMLRDNVASQGPRESAFGAFLNLADRIAALLPPEGA
jgi:hypothetical protein